MSTRRLQRLVSARMVVDGELDGALDALAQRIAAWRVVAGGLAEAATAGGLSCAGALSAERDLERVIRGRLGLSGRREHRRLLELDADLLRSVLSGAAAPVDITPDLPRPTRLRHEPTP